MGYRQSSFLELYLLFVLMLSISMITANALTTTPGKGIATTPPASLPLFPMASTTPSEVLNAQLAALRDGDLWATYQLFSRARRLIIDDSARVDMRQANLPTARITAVVQQLLDAECPGLLGHTCSHQILSAAVDPSPAKGRIPTTVCRVAVGSLYYLVTLTRQSAFDGGDPRDNDGFERCWFVWSIQAEGRGNGRDVTETGAPPNNQKANRRVPVLFG